MKYVNAMEVLPKELISEIQKYVEGNIIYIPNKSGKRTRWGEKLVLKLNANREIMKLEIYTEMDIH